MIEIASFDLSPPLALDMPNLISSGDDKARRDVGPLPDQRDEPERAVDGLSVHLRALVHVRPALGYASDLLPRQAGESVELPVRGVWTVSQGRKDLTHDGALSA